MCVLFWFRSEFFFPLSHFFLSVLITDNNESQERGTQREKVTTSDGCCSGSLFFSFFFLLQFCVHFCEHQAETRRGQQGKDDRRIEGM